MEELQSYGIGGYPVELEGITLHKEFVKLHVGVVWRMFAELVFLHKVNEGKAKLKVVGLCRGANNKFPARRNKNYKLQQEK